MEMKFKTLALALMAGAVVLLGSCSGKKDQQAAAMAQQGGPVQVATYTVTSGNLDLNESYPATIKGFKDVDVRPQVSANITRVCVDEGQRVSRGQLLFTLDDVQLQAAVRQAESAVASAKAQIASAQSAVASARLTANNQKELYKKGIISSYQYETAALQLSSAQAQENAARSALAQAQAAVVNAKKSLSFTRVVAPCSGVVGTIPFREGTLASPSTALTTISDNSTVYAYFSLNEKQILKLTQNGAISLQAAISRMPGVRLRLSDGTIYGQAGRVSTVSGVLDQSTGTASVRALFPNQNGMLHSGTTGDVLVPASTSGSMIIVPQKATYEVQDQIFVYVIGQDGKATSRAIKVLDQNDGQNYAVVSGLKVGEVIALEGIGTQVKDGVTVKSTNK